jgi:hypothetical protein
LLDIKLIKNCFTPSKRDCKDRVNYLNGKGMLKLFELIGAMA